MSRALSLTAAWLCGISLSSLAQSDSLDIKIGQMLLIGFPGTEADTSVVRAIRQGKAGAVIFFEKNIPKTNSFQGMKKVTWAYQSAAGIPLLVCIDQEGGRVNRLKDKYGFTRSLSAAQLGKYRSVDSVRFYAEATAATLRGLGFNMNFAPVVDLATNPDNPIIAKVERAYSADPDSVVWFASEVIRQHRRLGVLTALKHFPGHGSSKDDTHKGLTDVTNTWEDKELTPYKQLLKAGLVDAVMTTHIVNRNLDENALPGTLSKKIIQGILRDRIGYQGVVFTDDMQMHAITKYFGLEESIKLTINAGVDILCFSNNIQGSDIRTVDRVHSVIRSFVEKGEIPLQRIEESFGRIMKLKARLALSDEDRLELELAKVSEELYKLKQERANTSNSVSEPASNQEQTAPSGKKRKRK
jgi:beta-N-acetylhexosaminidase